MPASKTKQAEVAERRERVVAMRARGIPPSVIARELDISDETVYDDTHRTLKARREALNRDRDLIAVLEAEELDEIRRGAWEIARATHLHVSAAGRVALHPDTDEPIRDVNPNLQAYNLLLRTQARRAQLIGLDSAQKLDVRAEVVTLDAIDAALAELREEQNRLPPAPRSGIPEQA